MANKMYIAEVSGESLELDYVPPSINISREASIAQIEVVGRNTGRVQWTGGNTTASMQVALYAPHGDRLKLVRQVNWLQSLTYKPRNGVVKPVLIVLHEGSGMFDKYAFLVKSAKSTFSDFRNSIQSALKATVDLDFVVHLALQDLHAENLR
jgi:hypothetical protein